MLLGGTHLGISAGPRGHRDLDALVAALAAKIKLRKAA
jgi:hypothetical protein